MYGRLFESMYEGSMYGAGVAVFAVWGYVIAVARFGRIELNPRKLADVLGGEISEITEAVAFLTQPDPGSRFKEEEGRRLVKEGEYQYRIPSWDYYQTMKNETHRREYNRLKTSEYRARRKAEEAAKQERKALGNGKLPKSCFPTNRERAAVRAAEEGREQEPIPVSLEDSEAAELSAELSALQAALRVEEGSGQEEPPQLTQDERRALEEPGRPGDG